MEYPSDRFDHQGTFSLVKELTLKDGKLYQYPVPTIKDLRAESQPFTALAESKNSYELELNLAADTEHEIILFADKNGKGLRINFDLKAGQVTVDRSQAGEPFALDFGTSRSCNIDKEAMSATIFIDKSILKFSSIKERKYFPAVSSQEKTRQGLPLPRAIQPVLTMN